jgi:hypothetical protein
MRAGVLGLVIATSLFCAACSGEHRPGVSPAAAKSAIERRASEWSTRGKIVDLSCQTDATDSTVVSCDGSPLECRGTTPFERWFVSRGAEGGLVVSDPQADGYCIVNVKPGARGNG